jgi:hypothetical protein
MLLTLLSFAHLTGPLSSEDVVKKCSEDPLFSLISQSNPPAADEVRRFRRENRGLIKGLVAPVLLRAVREQFGLGSGLVPAGLKKFIVDNVVERLDLARYMDMSDE